MRTGHDEHAPTPSDFFAPGANETVESEGAGRSAGTEDEHAAYALLLRLASARLRGSPPQITLQATALAHEAWIRLANGRAVDDARPLVALAATAIRCALVDAARTRNRAKRGGGAIRVPLEDVLASYEDRTGDLLALEEALNRYAELDPRGAALVELRFFAGQSVPDAARALGISIATAERDWVSARAWLRRALEG